MIARKHGLSVVQQAKALGIGMASVYDRAHARSDADLALMRLTDELHVEYPFAGSRILKGLLKGEGHKVRRRHVLTLVKRMGIEVLYRRPNTLKPTPRLKIYPDLLPKDLCGYLGGGVLIRRRGFWRCWWRSRR
jgi:putative transposase